VRLSVDAVAAANFPLGLEEIFLFAAAAACQPNPDGGKLLLFFSCEPMLQVQGCLNTTAEWLLAFLCR
jgi:hypothetical protein